MIEKLAYLVALTQERSFRLAAQRCGVAQPTLSAGIKQLEEDLGVLLVRRTSRYQGLTEEGDRVLTWATRLVADARNMRQELQAMRTGLTGHLRLAVVPTALSLVPELTNRCLQRHPALQMTVVSTSSDEIRQMLDRFEAEAGITYLDNEALGRVRTVPLFAERYCLMVRDDSPLAGLESIGWGRLAGLRLCLLTPDMQNRRIMDRLMRGAGVEPRPALESNSQLTLLAHVLSGGWATVLPLGLADTLVRAGGLRQLRLVDPDAAHQIGLVVPDREPMTLLGAAVLAEAVRLQRSS